MAPKRKLALAAAAVISLTAIGSTFAGGEGSPEPAPVVIAAGSAPVAPTSSRLATDPTDPTLSGDAPATTSSTGATTSTTPPVVPTIPSLDDAGAGHTTPTPPAAGGSRGNDTPTPATPVPSPPVHDDLPGAGSPPPAGGNDPGDPIGDLDDDRPVPTGLDLTAPPKKPGAPNGLGGPGGLAVAPSCSHQCITKGVAYPRGFGAELVVETSVPAVLFMTVVADLDGNGTYEDLHVESTEFPVTSHSWALDHLEPGQTYHAMVAATDEHQHTAYAWGEFTTLSTRTVFAELGDAEIIGGPGNIERTRWALGVDGPLSDVTPGDQGILLYPDLPRYVDLEFWMVRFWDDKVCESWSSTSPQGHSSDACAAWNSTTVADVDLDQAPAGKTRWTKTSVTTSLHPPTGEGDALPPGYGDPYYFFFEVPVTLHVTYS